MLQEIILQKDASCDDCGQELPKGNRCYVEYCGCTEYESVYCLGCVAVE